MSVVSSLIHRGEDKHGADSSRVDESVEGAGAYTTWFYSTLILQIVVIYLGKKRKLTRRTRIQFLFRCAYLMADWVATVALGVLLNNLGEVTEDMVRRRALNVDTELAAFWAPFLLLYLGGPNVEN